MKSLVLFIFITFCQFSYGRNQKKSSNQHASHRKDENLHQKTKRNDNRRQSRPLRQSPTVRKGQSNRYVDDEIVHRVKSVKSPSNPVEITDDHNYDDVSLHSVKINGIEQYSGPTVLSPSLPIVNVPTIHDIYTLSKEETAGSTTVSPITSSLQLISADQQQFQRTIPTPTSSRSSKLLQYLPHPSLITTLSIVLMVGVALTYLSVIPACNHPHSSSVGGVDHHMLFQYKLLSMIVMIGASFLYPLLINLLLTSLATSSNNSSSPITLDMMQDKLCLILGNMSFRIPLLVVLGELIVSTVLQLGILRCLDPSMLHDKEYGSIPSILLHSHLLALALSNQVKADDNKLTLLLLQVAAMVICPALVLTSYLRRSRHSISAKIPSHNATIEGITAPSTATTLPLQLQHSPHSTVINHLLVISSYQIVFFFVRILRSPSSLSSSSSSTAVDDSAMVVAGFVRQLISFIFSSFHPVLPLIGAAIAINSIHRSLYRHQQERIQQEQKMNKKIPVAAPVTSIRRPLSSWKMTMRIHLLYAGKVFFTSSIVDQLPLSYWFTARSTAIQSIFHSSSSSQPSQRAMIDDWLAMIIAFFSYKNNNGSMSLLLSKMMKMILQIAYIAYVGKTIVQVIVDYAMVHQAWQQHSYF